MLLCFLVAATSYYIYMGGLLAKIIFKTGKEELKPTLGMSFFDFKIKDIRGKLLDFQTLRDKKLIMVVNVACK